jgi:hypothetical protein
LTKSNLPRSFVCAVGVVLFPKLAGRSSAHHDRGGHPRMMPIGCGNTCSDMGSIGQRFRVRAEQHLELILGGEAALANPALGADCVAHARMFFNRPDFGFASAVAPTFRALPSRSHVRRATSRLRGNGHNDLQHPTAF